MLTHGLSDLRCSYWELDVNDGPPEPLSGTAGALIASMGSIAVGFGTMLAAPSKALYSIAVKHHKTMDAETMSIQSDKSAKFPRDSVKKSVLYNISGGVSMRKSQSDQSSIAAPSFVVPPFERADTIDRQLKRDLGPNGIGRVLKATVEGIWLNELR